MFELAGDDDTTGTGVPATFSLRAVDADGDALATFGPFTAGPDGSVTATVPGSATRGVNPDASTGYREVVALQLVDAVHESTSAPDGTTAAIGPACSRPPTGPVLENSFVSSVGWVKPGDTYPFTLRVKNYGATPAGGRRRHPDRTATRPRSPTRTGPAAAVTIARRHPDLERRHRSRHSGTDPGAAVAGRRGDRRQPRPGPAGRLEEPLHHGTLTYTGGRHAGHRRRSHGPKVIPPDGRLSTPPATATGRSPSSRSTSSTARTTRPHTGEHARRRRSTTRRTRARRSTSTRRCPTGSSSRTAPCPSAGIATRGLGRTARASTSPDARHQPEHLSRARRNADLPGDRYQPL